MLACILLVGAIFTALQVLDYHKDLPSNDTYQYAKQTMRILGHSESDAVHEATVLYCADGGTATAAGGPMTLDQCLYTYRDGLTPQSPRYLKIFTSRPGYPVLAAPFAAAFGLHFGLWAAALLCTLAASVLVFALVRAGGFGNRAALVGQALFLAAPTGYWGTRLLSDGPSLVTVLLALLGAMWMVKGRVRAGAVVLTVGLLAGFGIRYSSEQPAALLLALSALVCLWRWPATRTRGMKTLALTAGIGFLLSEAASTLLNWPGLSESMQDTFTHHFEHPDVRDPLIKLVKADQQFWVGFPVYDSTALLMASGLIVLAVLLLRRHTLYGALVVPIAATGLIAAVAHPVASQADRLLMPVWLVLALGVPPLIERTGAALRPAVLRESQPSPMPLAAVTVGKEEH